MNKKKFYLYVQRYLLNFVVDLNVRTPLNTVLKKLPTLSTKNQYNTCFKLKILDYTNFTKGVETLNFTKTFFVQEQYKLSKDLLCAPYLNTLEITVYCNYSFLYGLSRIPLVQHLLVPFGDGASQKVAKQHLAALKPRPFGVVPKAPITPPFLERNGYFSRFFYVNSRILYASLAKHNQQWHDLWPKAMTFGQSLKVLSYHQNQNILSRPKLFSSFFRTKRWSCVKDGRSFVSNGDKINTCLLDWMTQLSPPKFFRHSEGLKVLSDNNYECKFVYKAKPFKPFVLRVAKDQVHQSLLNSRQKLFRQNKILLGYNFFLLFHLLKVYKRYKIMPNQKVFSKTQGIRKVVILVKYWPRRHEKMLTLLELTALDSARQLCCYKHRKGVKGLKNLTLIKSVNSRYFQLFRPLVTLTRLDSFYICESLKLPIYPDKSNNQVQFLRNRVRKQILPSIRILLNPQFDTLFCKFSESYTQS